MRVFIKDNNASEYEMMMRHETRDANKMTTFQSSLVSRDVVMMMMMIDDEMREARSKTTRKMKAFLFFILYNNMSVSPCQTVCDCQQSVV